MSEVKQKTKMKTGTVAIVALSLVLVLSLVATITLAYFTASRNVVTTIQFANGVSLQMYGVAFKTGEGTYDGTHEDTPPSNTARELYWKAVAGTGGNMSNTAQTEPTPPDGTGGYGGYRDVNDVLEFQNMLVRTVDDDAFVAIKLIVTATNISGQDVSSTLASKQGFVLPAFASGWKLYDNTTKGTADPSEDTNGVLAGANWYVYTGAESTIQKLPCNGVNGQNYAGTEDDPDNYELIFGNYGTSSDEGYKIPTAASYMNDFAGMKFVYRVIVVASDTQAGLNAMINDSIYVNTGFYGV